VQWVVTPDENGICPAPNATEVMALIARMQDDFLSFSTDIQQVVVTPVNTSDRVSFRAECPIASNTLFPKP
jgi:hypothetical protein